MQRPRNSVLRGLMSLTMDSNGTALSYTRYNTGVLANDYIMQSKPRGTTTKAYRQLDFSGSYAIRPKLSLFLMATNLLRETIFKYQLFPNRPAYAGRMVALLPGVFGARRDLIAQPFADGVASARDVILYSMSEGAA